jgi:hypothetical protein
MSLLALVVGFTVPLQAAAVQILPACASGTGFGNCDTCDMFALTANLATLILELLGGAVLLMVVIGGVTWIVSAGNPNLVQKGQAILVGAAVGTLIVLGGYFIVNAVIGSFTGDNDLNDVQLFGTNWATYCEEENTAVVVSACADRRDGTACTADGCTDSSCQCFNQQCVPGCIITWQDDDAGSAASCVADAGSCAGSNGGSNLCPGSAPYCCVEQSGVSVEQEEQIEEDLETDTEACVDKVYGDACISISCEEGCSCDADAGRCVPSCQVLFNTETSLGTCIDYDSCIESNGVDQGAEGEYGCSEATICCEFNTEE